MALVVPQDQVPLLLALPTLALLAALLFFHVQGVLARRRYVAELRESDQRFLGAFHHAAIGMALVSREGAFLQANAAFRAMLGRPEESLRHADFRGLVRPGDLELLEERVNALVAGEAASVEFEVRGVHADGRDVWMALNVSFMREWADGRQCLIVQAQDVTARRLAEERLYHEAYHDALTGLANRALFEEHLRRAIARCERSPERRFAVMYLDFDRFKLVNDSLGHRAGDELLRRLAERLQLTLRPMDLIARLGGDEFAILLENVHRERDAGELAARIHKALTRPFTVMGMEVSMSASIGITFSAVGYRDAEAVVRDADIAMYKAKSAGKGCTALFDTSLHEQVTRQLRLENDIRRALGEEQFFLEFQPIYALGERACVGVEALARWSHPERGVLQAAAFVPAAEDSGLVVPLGNWLLEAACRQMKAWREECGTMPPRMSVNISRMQLAHRDFVAQVRASLEANGLAPRHLALEVTESALMDGIESGLAALEALRDLGVLLSIDDFGTGYSSLSRLAAMPIDAFKVDRKFVAALAGGAQRSEIVRAIVRLGQTLDKQVLAEGIETEEQLAVLRALGCRFGQGNLLCGPVPAARVPALLAPRELAEALP